MNGTLQEEEINQKEETIQKRFEVFHEANPWVYDGLVRLAREMKDRGRNRLGIARLFEGLRWEYYRTTDDPNSQFKLNNNFRSRYVRQIIDSEPDLADMFEIRELKAP